MTTKTTRSATRKMTRNRMILTVGTVAVLGGAALWVYFETRGSSRDSASSASANSASGASDMSGMNGTRGAERTEGAKGTHDTQGAGGMGGMDMSSAGNSDVMLSANQIREFGITFGTVEMRTLDSRLRTVGNVTFDETRMEQVAPRFSGFVEKLYVETTGQPVRRGQALMDVYSPELLAAQEELLIAGRLDRTLDASSVPGVVTGSSDLVAAAKRRLGLLAVSDAQIAQVLRTGRALRTITIYAPTSGIVVAKQVVQGQAFQAGQTLYTLADLSAVWVDVDLRESDIASVREGTSAVLEFASFPGQTFRGRVAYVYPTLEEASRTVRARVVVANGSGLLKPGMYATVLLSTPGRTVLSVPASAIVRTGRRSMVFVDLGAGERGLRLAPQEVETGTWSDTAVEVLSGLEPGQRVVTSAQFLLESESNLGEVMKAMMMQMGSGDMGKMPGMDGMDMKGNDMKGMPGMTPSSPAPPKPAPPMQTGKQR